MIKEPEIQTHLPHKLLKAHIAPFGLSPAKSTHARRLSTKQASSRHPPAQLQPQYHRPITSTHVKLDPRQQPAASRRLYRSPPTAAADCHPLGSPPKNNTTVLFPSNQRQHGGIRWTRPWWSQGHARRRLQ
ncbi:hypothetical protein K469DRAFT_306911 [Zopfia rhizophila CBS 207.26]|uniref:Uncharacterized protein n=1 Tax=Zopfia rhizophila CBS 207.26 TaxID=1314779 RepID=A0A6A6ELL2_9PEZI|nr:hypothetical protein K469DRAFT_306911 [Zopfia rhizophila CBS 207.26]